MTAPRTLSVDLGARSYPIHIGPGLLDAAGALLADRLRQPRVFIVTDENVAPLYLDRLRTALGGAGIAVAGAHVVAAGEASKSFAVLEELLSAMLAAKCERRTTVVALGGGVVGDLAGFAAAVLLRGVEFVQIPTTLLAQVDSSVGGKTGINTAYGKNLVGAFHQPRAVLIDTDVLDSLPRRELLAGYAEVCKYGLLGDAALWAELVRDGRAYLETAEGRARMIEASCAAKAATVAADEKESGQRALLNLGHTFGHALEAELAYDGTLLHGEGVALGMLMAFDLSERAGLCPAGAAREIEAHFADVGLPVRVPSRADGARLEAAVLFDHMGSDKKVVDGAITFVLARGIGQAFLTDQVPQEAVLATLNAFLAR